MRKRAGFTRKALEAEQEGLGTQLGKLRAEIARGRVRQERILRMLSELPEVAEALRSGVCPAKIDAETWAALQGSRRRSGS
ncbi:MAG TPA: hypothetical protein VN894_07395 [Polyangiaceae bacterium]|nr:hypothetical protein [Polyangiaceae bacterium]